MQKKKKKKNLPAKARDTGSIPGPGRSHMPATTEPVLCNKISPHNEKPTYHSQRVAPTHRN